MEFLVTPITDFFNISPIIIHLTTLAISLVVCFFGQKLVRILVTWGGAIFGGILFLSAQQAWLPDLAVPDWGVALIGAVLVGVLCGFLYRAGLFCFFALMGATIGNTIAPLLQFEGYVALLFMLVIAIVLGILAVLLERPFVISATAIVGGFSAVRLFFELVHVHATSFPIVLTGILFALMGIMLQLRTTDK